MVQAAKEQWLRAANPLPAFIEACCEREGKCWLNDLYAAFVDWAKQEGITLVQQKSTVKRNLIWRGYEIKRGNKGDRVIGLRLKARPSA